MMKTYEARAASERAGTPDPEAVDALNRLTPVVKKLVSMFEAYEAEP